MHQGTIQACNKFFVFFTVPKDRKSIVESVPEMESELKRVQMLMGDLQKQRQQLSLQVRHLTDKSQNLAQQMQWPSNVALNQSNQSPSSKAAPQVNSASPATTTWMQTDLDISPIVSDESQFHLANTNDKQEIKTVRIVKRESERRHRERSSSEQNKGLYVKDDIYGTKEDQQITSHQRTKSQDQLPVTSPSKSDFHFLCFYSLEYFHIF